MNFLFYWSFLAHNLKWKFYKDVYLVSDVYKKNPVKIFYLVVEQYNVNTDVSLSQVNQTAEIRYTSDEIILSVLPISPFFYILTAKSFWNCWKKERWFFLCKKWHLYMHLAKEAEEIKCDSIGHTRAPK